MIVKQVSLDIEVDDSDIDLERIIIDLLESNGYNVLGSTQIDISDYYVYSKNNIKPEEEENEIER